MATCSVATLIDEACDSGFLQLANSNPVQAKAVEIALLQSIAGDDSTLGELIEEACESGFMQLANSNPVAAVGVEIQLLCNISEG